MTKNCNFFALDFQKYGSGLSEMNCQKTLKLFRKDKFAKLNKFHCLSEQVKGNIDILLISETKIDNSFPVCQFIIDGFSPPYRLDHN